MTKARTRRDDRPAVILDAAEALLRRSGSRTLTIDAVALEAGLSKGGVLHHFASKDALITALTRRKVERLRTGMSEAATARPGDPAALVLGMLDHARQTYADECGLPDSLLIASAENAEAMATNRAFLEDRIAEVETLTGESGRGAILVFAMFGLMVSRSLRFQELDEAVIARVFTALEGQARSLMGAAPSAAAADPAPPKPAG